MIIQHMPTEIAATKPLQMHLLHYIHDPKQISVK